MERLFISLDIFNKLWGKLGLSDDDLKDLEEYLCIHPDAGIIIQNTGGVRKLRWSLPGRGKSGGVRVLYIDFLYYERIYLLYVYPKSKKENISSKEKNEIRQLVDILKHELRLKYEK